MPAFGKEVVEFGQTGLKEILAMAKDLETQAKSTTKATEKLNKAIGSGAYTKAISQYKQAQKALEGVRKEQEKVTVAFKKHQQVQQYGRFGAFAVRNAGAIGAGFGAAGRGIGRFASSGLGVAASLGAPLAIGALANRGFQGTAAAAQLEAQFTRLSRTVANDLIPVIMGISKITGKIANARENVQAGRGSTGDYATSAMLWGGGALGALKVASYFGGFSASGAAGQAVGYAGRTLLGAARFAVSAPGPVAAMTLGAYSMYRGYELGNQEDRLNDLTSRKSRNGRVAYDNQFTRDEYGKVKNLNEGALTIQDPEKRLSYIQRELKRTETKYNELDEKTNRSWYNPRLYTSALFGSDPDKLQDLRLRKISLERMGNAAKGGEAFTDPDASINRIVEGAGERRSSGDLYEELATAAAKTMLSGNKDGESNSPVSILGDIFRLLNDVANKFNLR